MPDPKSGKAGSPVAPAEPKEALEADEPHPGQIAAIKAMQRQKSEGKYGSTPVQPHARDPEKSGWIEVELVDETGRPVAGEAFLITLPDGRAAPGTLDEKGFARVDGFDPGMCKVTFPRLDADAWARSS